MRCFIGRNLANPHKKTWKNGTARRENSPAYRPSISHAPEGRRPSVLFAPPLSKALQKFWSFSWKKKGDIVFRLSSICIGKKGEGETLLRVFLTLFFITFGTFIFSWKGRNGKFTPESGYEPRVFREEGPSVETYWRHKGTYNLWARHDWSMLLATTTSVPSWYKQNEENGKRY